MKQKLINRFKLGSTPSLTTIYYFFIAMAERIGGVGLVGLLVSLAVGGVIGVYVVAQVQPTLNPSLASINSTVVNTTVGNIFTQTYSAFNMWPIILIVVISVAIIAYVKLFR